LLVGSLGLWSCRYCPSNEKSINSCFSPRSLMSGTFECVEQRIGNDCKGLSS
jgi:hypothetical protein